MAEISTKPTGLPSTNALDKFDDLTTSPTEIRLGQAVLMSLTEPPAAGEYLDISARLYIKHAGFDQNTPDSPKVPVRQAKIIVAWPLGEQMPKPKSKNGAEVPECDGQEPLFEDDGDQPDADDAQQDTPDNQGESQEDGTVVSFTGGPAFSDGNGADD